MPIHCANGGDKVVLERWCVRETQTGSRHFVGFNIVGGEGRVSTPIQSFDPVMRTGLTASGSTYFLVGRAGHDSDAEYVWSLASKIWKIERWKDITAELVPDWRQGLPLSASGCSTPAALVTPTENIAIVSSDLTSTALATS
jgi:hypothetical protein